MATPKDKTKVNEDGINNPALFAGLKFYDGLMSRQRNLTICALQGDFVMWRNGLEDYYSFTADYISPKNKTLIEKELTELEKRIQNYQHFAPRIGNSNLNVMNSLKSRLFKLQTLLMIATSHLNLKTSKGDNGKFDVRSLFST